MQIEVLWLSARSATVALKDGGLYATRRPYALLLNGKPCGEARTVVASLYDLLPDTRYELAAMNGELMVGAVLFTTKREFFTLNARDFGAVGDGIHNDTGAIQAAITSCPPESRVLIPKGTYLVSPLFLKSHIRLELAEGATLLLNGKREVTPILPGRIESWDEYSEYNLGTWEGNPLTSYASLLTGVGVDDVELYGRGALDGAGPLAEWWQNPKRKRGAWRGRLLFLNRCRDVTVQGLTFRNSPSWTIHPYFSRGLRFLSIVSAAPANSPNTDGFDPESCTDVLLAGARLSTGDDCIAIKSGKLYMGAKYRTPCERIEIAHCLMEDGHGGVTIGSEMSGGVNDVHVHDCEMRRTDRGLRIKTRRGRGQQGVIDGVRFERVRMESVPSPFVVNAFYFCDPDGHSEYVQSREPAPVDERTPAIGSLAFRHVEARSCVTCAGFFLGLPERKIDSVELENVRFTFLPTGKPAVPAMADGVPAVARQGLIAENVRRIRCRNVSILERESDRLLGRNVDEIIWED